MLSSIIYAPIRFNNVVCKYVIKGFFLLGSRVTGLLGKRTVFLDTINKIL